MKRIIKGVFKFTIKTFMIITSCIGVYYIIDNKDEFLTLFNKK